MDWEKPWKKEFNIILDELSQLYSGKIVDPADSKTDSFRVADKDYFIYRSFHGSLNGIEFVIEINELPLSGRQILDGDDNTEYLRIHLRIPTKYKIFITQEKWGHKLQKVLRLDKEFQTGNEEFDKKFYLKPNSEKDKGLLKDSSIQAAINAVDSFAEFKLSSNGIYWSNMITKKNQLNIEIISNTIQSLIRMSEMVKGGK